MIPVQNASFPVQGFLFQLVTQHLGAMWCIVPRCCGARWGKKTAQGKMPILHWNHEFDADCCATLRRNRPYWNVIEGDVSRISKLDLESFFEIEKGQLDLLSGGAPCQAFSYAGKKLGLEDARGTLFYHYATFLEKLQPKMFLFENVRGLLTHDRGKTYRIMMEIFEQAGYSIQKKILNAWDYGVPQKRERLITIGVRKDLADKVRFAFPDPHDYKPVLRDILLDCPKS